jgi:hypothetical protein
VADGLRKCSGHDEHHVTLYTYVTLNVSKSRPALAGVVDRAPPPMAAGSKQNEERNRYSDFFSQKNHVILASILDMKLLSKMSADREL